MNTILYVYHSFGQRTIQIELGVGNTALPRSSGSDLL